MINQAIYGIYVITIEDTGSVNVTKNGAICDNTAAALKEVADQIGFVVDPKWNTRQLGSKILKAINSENKSVSTSALLAKVWVMEKKAELINAQSADLASPDQIIRSKAYVAYSKVQTEILKQLNDRVRSCKDMDEIDVYGDFLVFVSEDPITKNIWD